MHLGQVEGVRPAENPQGDVHHLQVLGPSWGGDLAGPGPDVVNDGVLEPGHLEVKPLGEAVVLYSTNPVEHDGPVPSLHRVHSLLYTIGSCRPSSQQLHSQAQAFGGLAHTAS